MPAIIIGLLIILIVFIVGIGLVLYMFLVRLSFKKTGIALSVIFVIAMLVLISGLFKNDPINREDARSILNYRQVTIKDDFKVINFESDDGFMDHHDKLVIAISHRDKLAFLADTLHPPFKSTSDTLGSVAAIYGVQKTQNESGNWEYMYIRPSEEIIDYSITITNVGDTLTIDEYHWPY